MNLILISGIFLAILNAAQSQQSTDGEIRLYFVDNRVQKLLYKGTPMKEDKQDKKEEEVQESRVKEFVHHMEQVIQEDQEELDKNQEEEEIEESNEKLNVLNDCRSCIKSLHISASQEILRMRREWMSHANLSRLGVWKKRKEDADRGVEGT